MNSRAPLLLNLYQLAAGLSDTATGLLLLLAPVTTLHLMRINTAPTPIVFISFIGAFVLGVGLSYLSLAIRLRRGLVTAAEWESQWRATAIIRTCIAAFLTIQVATSRMEPAWSLVALSDAALALIQFIGLSRGWLRTATGNNLG